MAATTLALGLIGLVATWANMLPPTAGIASFYLARQDMPVLLGFALMTVLVARTGGSSSWACAPPGGTLAWLLAAVTLVSAFALRHMLVGDLAFVRDEQMADFDAALFGAGRLFAPVAEGWRPVVDATSRLFMLPVTGDGAVVSAYLPIHALIRAVVGRFADPDWTSPLMAAVSFLALHSIARRLWPNDGASQWVALGALLLSAQYWLTATSGMAMAAHLALNLIWLALFLRDRPWSHAAALVVGFAATGLHQPIFHPLFVAPFLLWLVTERRWRLAAFYVGGYVIVGLFWLGWPVWLSATAAAATGGAATSPAEAGVIRRIVALLTAFDLRGLLQMAINLARFAAWSHLLLVPLAFAGAIAGWRKDPLVRALALGPVLTVAAMALLLPEQGHGWGYRYLHGLLGNFALLAAFGWQAMRARGRDCRTLIYATTLATLAALIWLGWQAHRMIRPFAVIEGQIAAVHADYVLIDVGAAPYARDRVINNPDLTGRPIRLSASAVRADPAWRGLCAGRTVRLFGAKDFATARAAFGMAATSEDNSLLHNAAAILARAGCRIENPL